MGRPASLTEWEDDTEDPTPEAGMFTRILRRIGGLFGGRPRRR